MASPIECFHAVEGLLAVGRREEAWARLAAFAAAEPDQSGFAPFMAGHWRATGGDAAAAAACYRRAIAADPAFHDFYRALGGLVEGATPAVAEAAYRRGLRVAPASIQLKLRLGALLRRRAAAMAREADGWLATACAPKLTAAGWWVCGADVNTEWGAMAAPAWEGRRTPGADEILAVLERVKGRRRAVDIGANYGFWTYVLARCFAQVEAFEASGFIRACLERNIAADNAVVHPFALSDKDGAAEFIFSPGAPGLSRLPGVDPPSDGLPEQTVLRRLDDFAFDEVDFVKIDVEGHEAEVLAGARGVLTRHKPLVCIELWSGPDCPAGRLLEEMGARCFAKVGQDNYLYAFGG